MADASDVMQTLVSVITPAVYPNGTGSASVIAADINVFPGWPIAETLKAKLAAGACQVSVYPLPTERNTTRYPRESQTLSVNTPTLTLTASGQTVTVGGAVPPSNNPHNAVIFVNGKPYVYAVLHTDTLNSIAAALAALIVVDVAGSSAAGAVVTLPSTARLGAVRTGITGTSAKEIRRQERVFQLTVWADTPAHRDVIAQAIDVALAQIDFLTMPDGFGARLIYKGSPMTDAFEKTGLYRRDLLYTVEYATTVSEVDTQVTQTEIQIGSNPVIYD